MTKEEITGKTSAELIDMLIEKEKEAATVKSEIEVIKGEIQARGLSVLEERNAKYIEFFGNEAGIASVQKAQKVEIVNYFRLQELMGKEFISEKIARTPEIKYTIDKKFQQALASLITGDYAKGYTLEEVVNGITKDAKQRKLLLKKLKGDYKTDKKTICSITGMDVASADINTELFLIGKIKNWQMIEVFFNTEDEAKFNKLKSEIEKCISVDETIKTAAKSIKEENVA